MHAHPKQLAAQFELTQLTDHFYTQPYEVYDALRGFEPIKVLEDGTLFLTRYDDVKSIYADTKLFCSDKQQEFLPKFGLSPLYEHHTSSLVFNDPPIHTQVRKVLVGALTPRAIQALVPNLMATIDGLADAVEDASRATGSVDLIEHFASAIPVQVIGDLLAIPKSERGPLREWSLAILGALEPSLNPQQLERGNQAVVQFLDYLRVLVADRRRFPLDADHDVLTRLIQAPEPLLEKHLLHNCIFLLNAGHETTTNLIGNGLEALLRFDAQRQLLVAQPELINSAVEEFLRFESSNQLGNRRAVAPFSLDGKTFESGTRIYLCIGAANRDPAQFESPHQLNVRRDPNRHLAFGFGTHVCAGLNLARLEARMAISQWLKRFPKYQLAQAPKRVHRARFRGFAQLMIAPNG